MSANVAGAEYVEAITRRESDRRVRESFRALVLQVARPGSRLFDFGSGPGLDARFYAERGFAVEAYDVDARMCEFFADYCREWIEQGRVRLHGGSYDRFLASAAEAPGRIDLVASNFAPLNLVGDLPALFACFTTLTSARGQVLASVLSPYCADDLRYGWWWRNLPRLWRTGHYPVAGSQAPIVRRRLASFATACAPGFVLERVFAGPALFGRSGADRNGCAPSAAAWLRLIACRYMFLLFTRRA